MTESPFRFAPLGAEHNRDSFDCGEEALDRYFRAQATQDVRRRIANCFVATDSATAAVAGYYTIAAAGVPFLELPSEVSKRLPRYPSLAAIRIGRLAVHRSFQGRGLGELLLMDAMRRSMKIPPAVYAVVVDAKNDRAIAFYQKYGFRLFNSQPRTLFLPMATAEKALLA